MGEEVVAGGMAHDIGEEAWCSKHPDRTNPGGICAFCLQEKLGKLISSKSSDPFFSNPSPPSFPHVPSFPSHDSSSIAPIPFFSALAARSKDKTLISAQSRNKSPISVPRKKSFWSFLTLSSGIAKRGSIKYCATKEEEADSVDGSPSGSQGSSSSGRKVARSRSVGCGSRSFSGDFFERISNGLGDCALRRAESHREAYPKRSGDDDGKHQRIKERVRCRGIFSGLGVMSFSSYWLSAATVSGDFEPGSLGATTKGGRSRSWGWAFASPMRAFKAGGGSQPAFISGAA